MATNTSPFDRPEKTYIHFPNDEYIDACIIAYQIADLPPGPLATTNDPVPSARFLMAGYIKGEDGNYLTDETNARILVRKWTDWMRISSNERSKMMQLFADFDNFFDILKDCDNPDSKLWTTPMKILLEQASNKRFQNIIRVKPGSNTELVQTAFYDDKYVPYKIVKAYGRPQPLRLAGCKHVSGITTYTPETMADAPQDA